MKKALILASAALMATLTPGAAMADPDKPCIEILRFYTQNGQLVKYTVYYCDMTRETVYVGSGMIAYSNVEDGQCFFE